MQLRPAVKILISLCAAVFAVAGSADAQVYGKLNALYACVGIVNPQVELGLSQHSTFQTELVVSPHKRIFGDHHFMFGILMNEYRYYFREHNNGFYLGANGSVEMFNMSKPEIKRGFKLQDRYCKGYGFMLGVVAGYEYRFCERWLLDAFVGFGYIASWYNGYSLDGTLELHPHGHEDDPFNGSAEWLPNKIGLSIGYRLFEPRKNKKH